MGVDQIQVVPPPRADLIETFYRGMADNTVGKIIDSLQLTFPAPIQSGRPRAHLLPHSVPSVQHYCWSRRQPPAPRSSTDNGLYAAKRGRRPRSGVGV